jgi:hypothetical protein
MALTKCKECGAEVSKKAESCPGCGAPVKAKTGCGTIILGTFLGLVVLGVIGSGLDQNKSSSNSSKPSAAATKTKSSKSAKPQTSWSVGTIRDEMTNKLSAYAMSDSVDPTKPMGFPYSDVSARLGVGCDGSSKWAYIGFSSAPNLSNDETEDGYNRLKTRIKWNERVKDIYFTQKWGAKSLHFEAGEAAINSISTSNTVMIEIPWHGEGLVRFNFPLNGSTAAITDMKSKCKQ